MHPRRNDAFLAESSPKYVVDGSEVYPEKVPNLICTDVGLNVRRWYSCVGVCLWIMVYHSVSAVDNPFFAFSALLRWAMRSIL